MKLSSDVYIIIINAATFFSKPVVGEGQKLLDISQY